MKSFEVIDNFLDQRSFHHLKKDIESVNFLWTFCDFINDTAEKDYFSFVNLKVETFEFIESYNFNYVDIIMKELKKRNSNNTFEVIRAKANLFLKNDNQIKYGHHFDIEDSNDYETIIYYVNNNNGGTEFEDGTFVKQKENRALIIYGKQLHQSIGQTDEIRRINININYFRK